MSARLGWRIVALAAALCGAAAVQQCQVKATNFGGADEWLILELSARGVLSVPYAHRPLVLAWQQPPALFDSDVLTSFWAWSGLYVAAAGLLTALLVTRIVPGSPRLAFLAGGIAACWAPLDGLRLDTVLICGYLGATATTLAALVVFLESWRRRSLVLLGAAAGIAVLATMTVESTLPMLAAGPLLVWSERETGAGRWRQWSLAWGAVVLAAGVRAAAPALLSSSYQTGAMGLDPAPWRVAGRLLQLVGMQAVPLVDVSWRELAVWPAIVAGSVFALGWVAEALLGKGTAEAPPWRQSVRLLAAGALLCVAGHAVFALTQLRTPDRTQILSGPGFAICLAGFAGLLSTKAPGRLRGLVPLMLGVWVVAVGTGRVVAMQATWDAERSAFEAQRRSLAGMTAAAPAFRPGTLLLLIDEAGAWPTGFTFRHAIAYLYGRQVVGLAYGAKDFLYPYYVMPGGVAVVPWPVIRQEWGVAPSFHPWSDVVVARFRSDGRTEILQHWPEGTLPALPPDAEYRPQDRILPGAVRERERGILQVVAGS